MQLNFREIKDRTCYLGLSYLLGLYFAGGTGLACSLMGEMCDAHGPGPARPAVGNIGPGVPMSYRV